MTIKEDAKSKPSDKLSKLAKSGTYIPIIKGLYETDQSTPGYLIAESIYGPSYLSKQIPVNLKHLRERLLQSGHIQENDEFSEEAIKAMLCERFETIDYAQAKEDVEPFIRDTSVLNIWSADFFKQITGGLKIV